MKNPTTVIRINEGTIVGRIKDGKVTPVALIGDVYVEAQREDDGSWVYSVGEEQYCCAGGLATALTASEEQADRGRNQDWPDYLAGFQEYLAGKRETEESDEINSHLDELKKLYLKLEDVYWRFSEMPNPDEDREDRLNQEYTRIHESMDEILASASTKF